MPLQYGTELFASSDFKAKAGARNWPRLNPYVKRKWIKALLSGHYEQATETLVAGETVDVAPPDEPWAVLEEHPIGYCCLGVLVAEMRPDSIRQHHDGLAVEGNCAEIPDDLAILWGLEQEVQTFLAEANDDAHWGFKKIARWIKVHL